MSLAQQSVAPAYRGSTPPHPEGWFALLFRNAVVPLAVFRRSPSPSGEMVITLEEANDCFANLHEMPARTDRAQWLAEAFAKIDPDWIDLVKKTPTSGGSLTLPGAVRRGERYFSLRVVAFGTHYVCLDLADVTDQRQIEDRVRAAQRLENIGLLVSGISHDLNNLLTPGWMAASMLRRRHQSPEDLRLIDVLENSARSASEMIHRIMATVRETRSASAIMFPSPSLKEIIKILQVALPHAIRIESSIPHQAKPAAIEPALFSQVVLNLAINARDAMPDGGTLTLACEEVFLGGEAAVSLGLPAGDYVSVTVTDTGHGIPKEHLGRIFEVFFTTKQPGHGTGLGLARVKEIVENTGGKVTVESTVGQGSEFKLFIPVVATHTGEPIKEEIDDEPAPIGDMRRILVVDDYDGLRDTLVILLGANGYDPIAASDGHEGLKLLRKERPDLVLLDLSMPRTSGEEMLRHMRSAGDNTPVIVMTAHGPGQEFLDAEARLKALGVLAILRKPLREPTLVRAIANALKSPVVAD